MGIKNLYTILNKIGYKPVVSNINKLTNKVIAFDASILLYKYKSDNYQIELIVLLCELLIKNILPVFIFDGSPTPLKKQIKTLKKNELLKKGIECVSNIRLNKREVRRFKKILDCFHILHYTVNYREAEGFCSQLCKNNYVDYVITNDSDVIVYDCPKYIKNFSMERNFFIYEIDKIRLSIKKHMNSQENIDYFDYFVNLGTDYNKTNEVNEVNDTVINNKFMQIYDEFKRPFDIPHLFNEIKLAKMFIKLHIKKYIIKKIDFQGLIKIVLKKNRKPPEIVQS